MDKYTKDYINNLILDKEKFKKEILRTKGFLLYMASIKNISIPEDVILDTLSKYSIFYVDSLVKSKKMSVNFLNKYSEFLENLSNPDKHQKQIVNNLTINDIITNLNTDKFFELDLHNFNLSLDDLIKYQDVLLPYLKSRNNYGYEKNNNEKLSDLIHIALKKISIDDFKKLNIDFIAKNVDIFESIQNKNNYHFKEFAKEIVQHNIKNNIEFNYEYMIFYLEFKDNNETDKEIFNFLLNQLNTYDKRYDNLSNINYFYNNFPLEDWVLNYNIEDFVLMDEEKILQHADVIRNHYISKNKNYFRSHSLIEIERLKLPNSIKNKIFNEEFWENFILNSNDNITIELTDRDFDSDNKYLIDLNSLFIKIAKKNKDVLKKLDINSIFKLLSILEENYYYSSQYDIEKFKGNLYSIFENFDELLNSKLFLNYISDIKYEHIKKIKFDHIISSMQGKENFNYLVFLLSLNLNSNRFNSMFNSNDNNINNEINRIIPMFNFKQTKEIINHYNYSYYDYSIKSIIKSMVKSNDKKETFETNILNYSKEDLNNLSYEQIMSLYTLSDKFKKDLIKYDLDSKLITQYKNKTHYATILDSIFRGINNTSSSDYKFAKEFVSKNKEFANTHLLKIMKSNPHLKDLISVNSDAQNKYIYEDFTKSINDNLNNRKIDAILPSRNEDNYFGDLEYIFLQNKYFEASDLKDIIILQYVIKKYYPNNYQYIKEHFENTIKNSSFYEILKVMENYNLFDILVTHNYNLRYYNDRDSVLQFNENFTDDQKYKIILKIYNSYNLSEQTKENNKIASSFFSKENIKNHNVIKKFGIDIDYLNMWRGYDYLDIKFNKDEIIESINNMKKAGESLLSDNSTNASHDQLMNSILDYDFRKSKNNNTLDNILNNNIKLFTSILNDLKNDPINYLAMIHSHSIRNLFDNSNKIYESRDLGVSDMYNKYVDFDIIFEGIKKVHFDIKEHFEENNFYDKEIFKNKHGYYLEAYLKQLSHFVAFTYDNPRDQYLSLLDDEKTESLIHHINTYLPLFALELSQVGGLGNIKHVISNNFDKYYYPELIDNLFIYSFSKEITKGLNFSYDTIDKNWQSKDANVYFNNLVSYLINNKKYEDLHKIIFAISQNDFNDRSIVSSLGLHEFFDSCTSFVKEMPQFKNNKMSKLIDMMQLNDLTTDNNNVKTKAKKI